MTAMLAALLTGCGNDDDIIYDFGYITLRFKLVDQEGNNLLLENTAGSYFGKDIHMTMDGKDYPMSDYNSEGELEPVRSRKTEPAELYGLLLVPYDYWDFEENRRVYEHDNPVMMFGNFDVVRNLSLKMQLHIEGCDKPFNVELHNTFEPDGKGGKANTAIYFNGEYYPRDPIVITLPRYSEPAEN